ncbi:hypothetical protein [Legionella spiritensis]|uniref:Uncharacterized protein n=1 Tax=Legionella spiritensis TaxID=452 RepID=A0A0W0YX67_LEGSP|nr:hypothetical protein [Legionella spiritensis]KTD61442.1 hypothetical protein Lspi_2684 [Legionella spiritensis]SNV33910.1 Uncharacterised protein [Legionella spiritensis]
MKCTTIILTLLCLTTNSNYAAEQTQPIVCQQKYALCTSAACIPDPRHPDYAICACVVKNGYSVGYKTCEQRTPKEVQYEARRLVSTFSFAQFHAKKNMACRKGIPWTDCVDAPCTVNPMDPKKAICSCKIFNTQSFFTFGGDCDTKKCQEGFWSGTTESSARILRKPLLETLKLSADPSKDNTCSR